MKKLIILLTLLLLAGFGYWLYHQFEFVNVLVKFDELEPFERNMNVYFKGFKVGKTTKIYPNKDYTNTYLKVRLKAARANFPSNITMNIKKKKTGGYLNIVVPDNPSLKQLKNNDEIAGFVTRDISSLLEGENIQNIVEDADSLLESTNTAVQSLNGIFIQIQEIIADNRASINLAVKNLAETSANLNKVSANLEKSLEGDSVSNSIGNIEQTTANIKEITEQIDKSTVPIVNSVLCETHSTVKGAKEITNGVKNTLKKRMGLGRLLFGKPISDECY